MLIIYRFLVEWPGRLVDLLNQVYGNGQWTLSYNVEQPPSGAHNQSLRTYCYST